MKRLRSRLHQKSKKRKKVGLIKGTSTLDKIFLEFILKIKIKKSIKFKYKKINYSKILYLVVFE